MEEKLIVVNHGETVLFSYIGTREQIYTGGLPIDCIIELEGSIQIFVE